MPSHAEPVCLEPCTYLYILYCYEYFTTLDGVDPHRPWTDGQGHRVLLHPSSILSEPERPRNQSYRARGPRSVPCKKKKKKRIKYSVQREYRGTANRKRELRKIRPIFAPPAARSLYCRRPSRLSALRNKKVAPSATVCKLLLKLLCCNLQSSPPRPVYI